MIIHKPEINLIDGEVEISARIDFDQAIPNVPDRLWFRFPERCAEYLTDRGDAFLLCMLIPAMHYGEDIEVRAEVSPKLLYNLKEYQYLYANAYSLSQVNIRFETIKAFEPKSPPEGVLLTFSGGVDSMHALWSHLPENQPVTSMRVTHGLLIQGFNAFDIPLENPEHFNYVYEKYDQLYSDLGLSLLYVKTNIHDYSRFRIEWKKAHNATLIGIVYLLAGLVKTHIKAEDGGNHLHNMPRVFSESTHLLSSETLETTYFSRLYVRYEKLQALADWEPVQTLLRVCLNWQKRPDQLNCSRCRKCLITMINLQLIREYEKFKVFKQPYPRGAVIRWWAMMKFSRRTNKLFRILARENRHYDIYLTLMLLEIPTRIKGWFYRVLDRYLTDDANYKIRERFYNFPQVAETNDHS